MRLGINNLSDPVDSKSTINVADVLIHPKYKQPSLYYDIGIAVAQRIIEFTNTIRPICLPFQPNDDSDHEEGYFVDIPGWGNRINEQNGDIKVLNLKVILQPNT